MRKKVIALLLVLGLILIAKRYGLVDFVKLYVKSDFEYYENNELSKWSIEQNDTLIVREYFENGRLKNIYNTIEGKKNGEFKEFNNNGSIHIIRNYIMDSIKQESYYYYTNKDSLDRIEVFDHN